MAFDAVLNLFWAVLSVTAFVYYAASERQPFASRERRRRSLSLFLALVSLFPCVSASDDLIRFESLNSTLNATRPPAVPAAPQRHEQKRQQEKPSVTLVRLLEMLESFQVSIFYSVTVLLCFLAFVSLKRFRSCERFLPSISGRGPPLIGCLA